MSTTDTIVDAVTSIVGSENVVADEAGREFFSADISFEDYELASVVAQPNSTEELAAIVERANAQGFAVLARGGGMSYTQGYTPSRERTVLVDMRQMNKIREINLEDMYVVAEAGCTWEQLYDELGKHGVRTPYYGPLSGRFATVGGATSQNSVFWGGGSYATVADSVLGLEVVLSGGRVLHTGSWARTGCNEFMRHNGPDLTGIFTGDTGAYGLKAAAALRLVRAPEFSLGASFAVVDFSASTAAIAELSKYGIGSEIYGIDPFYTDALVRAGLEFLAETPWSIHIGVDGPSEAVAQAGLDFLKGIASKHGSEIDNTTVGVFKSDPFAHAQPVLLGPEGELWLPVHAFLPFSRSQDAAKAIEGWFEELAPTFEEHNIKTSLLTAASGKDFLFEPSFYWFDELGEFRLDKISPEAAAEWKSIPPDPETRSVVLELRRQLAKRFDELGCCHIQVGKYYSYESLMESETWKLTQGIKQLVDPDGLVNPGSLGL